MTRPPLDPAPWRAWMDHVCAAVGVRPDSVDVTAIHELTGEVAAVYERPMAPVAAHLWGLARGRYPDADPGQLREVVLVAARAAGDASELAGTGESSSAHEGSGTGKAFGTKEASATAEARRS